MSLKNMFGWAALGIGIISTGAFFTSAATMATNQFYWGAGINAALLGGGAWAATSGSSPAPAAA